MLALVSSAVARPDLIQRTIHRRTDAPPLPPCVSYTPYTYVGCFLEVRPRSLQYSPNLVFSTMTVETCTATCKSNGFRYAGLIYYSECVCGTVFPPIAPETERSAPCNGNPSQKYGADQRFSIWEDPTYAAVDQATITSQYEALGCYTEGSGYHADQLDANTLTTEACLEACGAQLYPLAATEFAGECYCGAMLQGGSVEAPETECNMACNGAPNEICGGPSRLHLYEADILKSSQPCGESPPPPPATCKGTAYGYAPGKSATFISLGIGKNWG
ncbi:WSC domain-containing protein [Halenospora varia]|nr:WSC domain-containing protein [Halenospora varia]